MLFGTSHSDLKGAICILGVLYLYVTGVPPLSSMGYKYQGTFLNVWSHFWWPRLSNVTGIWWMKRPSKGAAQYPIMYTMAPNNKELSGPKCKYCQGWETGLTKWKYLISIIINKNIPKIFANHSLLCGNMLGRTKHNNCNRIVLVGQEFAILTLPFQ